jgi:hypothetical protein
MQTNILDLSKLSTPLQQELIDFYEFLLEKQTRNKTLWQASLETPKSDKPTTGFAMLKTNCSAVSPDFDPASLLNRDRT